MSCPWLLQLPCHDDDDDVDDDDDNVDDDMHVYDDDDVEKIVQTRWAVLTLDF